MTSQTTSTGRVTGLLRGLDLTVTVVATLFWAGVLFWAQTQTISQVRYATMFVGGIMTVYALDETREAITED